MVSTSLCGDCQSVSLANSTHSRRVSLHTSHLSPDAFLYPQGYPSMVAYSYPAPPLQLPQAPRLQIIPLPDLEPADSTQVRTGPHARRPLPRSPSRPPTWAFQTWSIALPWMVPLPPPSPMIDPLLAALAEDGIATLCSLNVSPDLFAWDVLDNPFKALYQPANHAVVHRDLMRPAVYSYGGNCDGDNVDGVALVSFVLVFRHLPIQIEIAHSPIKCILTFLVVDVFFRFLIMSLRLRLVVLVTPRLDGAISTAAGHSLGRARGLVSRPARPDPAGRHRALYFVRAWHTTAGGTGTLRSCAYGRSV
ncbi:hypothetical protein C8Q80DRAFT_1265788 [Daedaleopsis nitida]|nr:hypothetical protein C8Q80DRAFT_1265788 [Daedaleopsis nitida]